LNQLICESRPSEVRALESLTVDEYYQTISTWMRIIDEKNKSFEKINSGDDEKPKERRKFGKAKKV
jgi:hypothetical protein